jgi:hypothetical protein
MVLSRRESAMEPTKPNLPREAIELYNDFIDGEISRLYGGHTPTSGRSRGSCSYRCIDAELCAGPAGFPHR